MRTLDIAVCGSGIGGLAAAIALHAKGHRVTIFEKVDTPKPVGSGLMLQPTGQAALARLGILETVLEHGRILQGIKGDTRSGRTIFDIRYADLGADTFGIGIHRGTLFYILDSERNRLAIPVVTGTDVAGSGVSADKRVVSNARGEQCGSFDLVVDATGLRSPLRKAHARVTLDRPYPYGAVWGVVHEPPGWHYSDCLTQRYDRANIMIGLLPIGMLPGSMQPLTAFFWSLRTADMQGWRAADFATWQADVAALWPAAAGFVSQFGSHAELASATYSDVWLKSPVAERLALLGDSARAASPQLGQGANLALIDAAVLADSLSAQPTVAAALAAYARSRHAHTRFYGRASRWLTPFFQSDSNYAAAIRDVVFAPMARIPVVRREMVRTLAGLKTGIFNHKHPQQLVSPRMPAAAAAKSPFLVRR